MPMAPAQPLQLEKEMGSIVPGKLANFTILADNPVTCAAAKIKDIAVVGTIHEGRVFPVKLVGPKTAGISLPENYKPVAASLHVREIDHAYVAHLSNEATCTGGECSCSTGRHFAEILYPSAR